MKTSKVSLEIALKEINFILESISPLPDAVFENDPFIQRSAVLSIIIIGEETKKVNEKIKSKYYDIPWELMAAMRNKMVHNYDGIDTSIVLKTIKEDIPVLKRLIEEILSTENELLNN